MCPPKERKIQNQSHCINNWHCHAPLIWYTCISYSIAKYTEHTKSVVRGHTHGRDMFVAHYCDFLKLALNNLCAWIYCDIWLCCVYFHWICCLLIFLFICVFRKLFLKRQIFGNASIWCLQPLTLPLSGQTIHLTHGKQCKVTMWH